MLRAAVAFPKELAQVPPRYSEKMSKARNMMSLYGLVPSYQDNCLIAPTASLVGEVTMGSNVWVGHGAVIRGDINAVLIINSVIVGNHTVIHTAASTSTGYPAYAIIEQNVVIGHGCTLYSCTVKDEVWIGHNSVIMEGAVLESGCVIGPNSVVPPGRVVPAHQVWVGNPIKFSRTAFKREGFLVRDAAHILFENGLAYARSFLPFGNAYLYRENPFEGLEEEGVNLNTTRNWDAPRAYQPYKTWI